MTSKMEFVVGDAVRFASGPFSYITETGMVKRIDQRSVTYPVTVRIKAEDRWIQVPASPDELEKVQPQEKI